MSELLLKIGKGLMIFFDKVYTVMNAFFCFIKKSFAKEDTVEYEFLPAALEITETPPAPLGRFTIWVIFSIIIFAIFWACIGKIDEVAVARGKVIPNGRLQVIQAMEEGIITAIHVHEGEKVKKGQLIIELDSTIKEADVDSLKKTLEQATIEKIILTAELTGKNVNKLLKESELILPSEEVIKFQKDLKIAREQEYSDKRETLTIEISQRENELGMTQTELIRLQVKYKLLAEQVAGLKELYDIRSIPEMEYRTKKNELDLLEQDIKSQELRIKQARDQIREAKKNYDLLGQERKRSIMDQMNEKDKTIISITAELTKAQKKFDFQTLTSPVEGTVHGLNAHTIGGVVTPAQPIATIVPEGTSFIVEATVLNKDIGFVHVDQDAEIKFDTFLFQKYGTITGKVVHVSPDAFEDEKLGPVYKIKVKLDKYHFTVNKNKVAISPGMSVSVEVKTGKRRIIDFFLSPLVKYAKEGLNVR